MKRTRSGASKPDDDDDDSNDGIATTAQKRTSNCCYRGSSLPEIISMSSIATTSKDGNDEEDDESSAVDDHGRVSIPCHNSSSCQSSPLVGAESPGLCIVQDVHDDENDDQDHIQEISVHSSLASCNGDQKQSTRHSSSLAAVALVFESSWQHTPARGRRHQERPQRITSIHQALQQAGLLSQCEILDSTIKTDVDDASKFLGLTRNDFYRVHLPGYLKRLEGYTMMGEDDSNSRNHNKRRKENLTCTNQQQNIQQEQHQDWLDTEAAQYDSIYLSPQSTREAKQAASSLCHLVRHVETQRQQYGFAIIRPPGHHAEAGMASGFCLLNNIALAASYAKHHLGKQRILIVDWDIHHGNGTQNSFIDDPNVMYFSIHGRHLFPHSNHGSKHSNGPRTVGRGLGIGYNINVAWSHCPLIGDDEYYAVWQHLLLPIAKEYQPDLVLISAGFDAAEGDVGGSHVTPECFGNLTRLLLQDVNCKVVAALEGGYVPTTLGNCVVQVVQALLSQSACRSIANDPKRRITLEPLPLVEVEPTAAKNIRETISANAPYWKCFRNET